MLDKVLRVGLLFDFYGALLTERQQQCLAMHYHDDLSLAEIAEEFGVSRQAIHDMLRRAEQILAEYEEKLKLVERYQSEQQTIRSVFELLDNLPVACGEYPQVKLAMNKLKCLLAEKEEA